MGEQPDNKDTELCNWSTDEKRGEEDKETGKSYEQFIEFINKNKKIMFFFILLCLAFIVGWMVGFNKGYIFGADAITQNYLNMTCFLI